MTEVVCRPRLPRPTRRTPAPPLHVRRRRPVPNHPRVAHPPIVTPHATAAGNRPGQRPEQPPSPTRSEPNQVRATITRDGDAMVARRERPQAHRDREGRVSGPASTLGTFVGGAGGIRTRDLRVMRSLTNVRALSHRADPLRLLGPWIRRLSAHPSKAVEYGPVGAIVGANEAGRSVAYDVALRPTSPVG